MRLDLPRAPTLRRLGWCWAAVLCACAGGGALLQALGPSRAPAAAVAERAAAPRPPEIAAPDPRLEEPAPDFPGAVLPRVGADGRMPRKVYARGFDARDPRPRVALLLTGLGPSDADSRDAVARLPGPVSLAVSPYAAAASALLPAVRAAGHELLVSIPMEPRGFPLDDAGPRALSTGAEDADNRRNLEWALSRAGGYVGATGALGELRGERFADSEGFAAVRRELAMRGLLYVDPRPGAADGDAARSADLVVDAEPTRAAVDAQLARLEALARERGSALGLAGPVRPALVERIALWSGGLEGRGLVLVPVSAVVEPRRPAPAAPP